MGEKGGVQLNDGEDETGRDVQIKKNRTEGYWNEDEGMRYRLRSVGKTTIEAD